jgi:hypothetical protein
MRKAEGGSGGSGDGFCMIDPVVLGGVINDLAAMEAAIIAETRGLKAEFELVGLSAGPVNDLVNISHWLRGELPMLRRRHAAAVLLQSQGMQWYPGTRMLAMPEDPDAATQQAADLAANGYATDSVARRPAATASPTPYEPSNGSGTTSVP